MPHKIALHQILGFKINPLTIHKRDFRKKNQHFYGIEIDED